MRASRKQCLTRLTAVLGQAEKEAFDRRAKLPLRAFICVDIRAAMERRGIDPASSRALLGAEATLADVVFSPERWTADAARRDAQRQEKPSREDSPWRKLKDTLDRIGEQFLDGSQPDFAVDPLMEVWAWALIQPRLLPAIPYDRYGRSDRTS